MSVSYFHIKPRDEFERPVKQLYMSDERTPKYFAASCVFTHLLMMFPFLSICKMGFDANVFLLYYLGVIHLYSMRVYPSLRLLTFGCWPFPFRM